MVKGRGAPPFFFQLFLIFAVSLLLKSINFWVSLTVCTLLLVFLALTFRNMRMVVFLMILLIPFIYADMSRIEGDVGVLGRVVDRRNGSYTLISSYIYNGTWKKYRDYIKFDYYKFSTETISCGKNVYVAGQLKEGYIKASYAAPSFGSSFFRIKEKALENLSLAVKDKEAFDIISASFMGSLKDKEVFKSSGTLHLFAVSGMQVYLFSATVFFVLRYLVRKRSLRLLINMGMVWVYMILTGFSPSSMRAGLLIIGVCLFKILDIGVSSFNILGLIGYLSLVFMPLNIYNVGFQMSYSSAFMILFSVRATAGLKKKKLFPLFRAAVIAVGAFLGVIPFCIAYFGSFSILGPFLTPLVEPVLDILMILCMVMVLVPLEQLGVVASFLALACKAFLKTVSFMPLTTVENRLYGLLISCTILWAYIFMLIRIEKRYRR